MMRFSVPLVFGLFACRACGFEVSFKDYSYQKVFSEQWSYDQHTTSGHEKHFDVGSFDGRTSLRVRIYDDDKALSHGSDTCPRSELSQSDKNALKSNVDYVAEWNGNFQQYTKNYQFAFMQIFGGHGPNIFLRWARNKYDVLCEKCSGTEGTFAGSVDDDLGKWIQWRVEFRLSTDSSGYMRVYKAGKKVWSYSGQTSDGSNHHFKLGLYTQHKPCAAKNATVLLSDLKLTSGSAPSPSPSTTPPPHTRRRRRRRSLSSVSHHDEEEDKDDEDGEDEALLTGQVV